MTVLAVFRSRTQVIQFSNLLHRYGIASSVVNAPKEANIGCALCGQFPERELARVRAVLKNNRITTFKGFYKTGYRNGHYTIMPLSS